MNSDSRGRVQSSSGATEQAREQQGKYVTSAARVIAANR